MILEHIREMRVVRALESCPGVVTGAKLDRNELTLDIAPERIVEACLFLKEQDQYNRLAAVTCVDRYPMEPRFEVIYHLHSIPRNERLRLKCGVGGERPEIESVYPVWRSADWYEREVFDLFGVTFHNHPNLRRILMPDDWQGHPLRKDYPVHGYKYSYQSE
jgi:NADH-quinone oxidoreductase subunit C